MLADPDMLAQARIKLDATGLNAEAVWQRTIDETMKGYQALDDAYLRARAADLEDLGRRVLRHLCGESGKTLTLDEPSLWLLPICIHPTRRGCPPTRCWVCSCSEAAPRATVPSLLARWEYRPL